VTLAEGEATFADDAQDGLRRALDRFTRALDSRSPLAVVPALAA
jgi:hypothetical protein